MPISITCSVCGAAYTLKDEFAGRRVKCRQCQNVLEVPQPVPYEVVESDPGPHEGEGYADELHDAFRRDKFLLRQKLWAIKDKYRVSDEEGQPILYVERPVYMTRGCLALFAGIPVVVIAVIIAALMADTSVPAAVAVGVIGTLAGLAIIIALYPKRHVQFFADESKRELVLEARQDQKIALINFWYTLTDADGQTIARLRKNYLHGILRRRWYIHSPEGEVLFEVKEDSIILSLLRRTIGAVLDEIPLLGLAMAAALRTNFIFTRFGKSEVIGEFNRRLTLLDRYVLDLTDDTGRVLDRRVAVAMGVLLDTGERR
jgi:uncharacterized protein YxjI